jgi:2-polyprenyl-6-hydroxyphenyl methylase/3-demethylubiquinone-9 3-methyltransferase
MNASTAPAGLPSPSSINPREAAHFGRLADDWWNPKGSSAMLHRLNPVRLAYLRERIDMHWGIDSASLKPLAGKRAIDVGCGAGLLTEPLARMGADTVGLDAAPENIGAALRHAAGQGLAISYRSGGIEAVAGEQFDLVTSMEVIEHVNDPAAFIRALAGVLAPDGLMVLSTPNRTSLSQLMMITLGEGTGAVPKGTHDWEKFLTPAELTDLLGKAGLKVVDVKGLSFSVTRGFHLSDNLSLDYLVAAVRS